VNTSISKSKPARHNLFLIAIIGTMSLSLLSSGIISHANAQKTFPGTNAPTGGVTGLESTTAGMFDCDARTGKCTCSTTKDCFDLGRAKVCSGKFVPGKDGNSGSCKYKPK
jgi:hypothetical protein